MSGRTDALDGAVERLVIRDNCNCGACRDYAGIALRTLALSLSPILLGVAGALVTRLSTWWVLLTVGWSLVLVLAVTYSLRRQRAERCSYDPDGPPHRPTRLAEADS